MLFKTTQSHDLNLSQSSVPGMLSLSILPLLLAFFFPLIYVLSDLYFLNQFDKNLSAQLFFYSPLCLLFTLVSLLIAPGAALFITKSIAQFDYESAENIAGSAILWIFIIGCTLSVFGYIGLSSIIEMNLIDLTNTQISHLYPYLIAIPFILLAQCYFDFLRAQGNTIFISLIVIFGFLINIALNYTANTYFNLGILGVSTATLISLIITCLILIIVFSTGQTEIRIGSNDLSLSVTNLFSIISQSLLYFSITAALPLTVLGMYFWTAQIESSSLNFDIFHHAFLISAAICFTLFSPCIALLLTYQSISIFNLSTFSYSRVKSAHKFSIRFIAIYGVLITAAIQFFPNEILNILAIDANLQSTVLELCLYFSLVGTFHFINASWSTFLQSQNASKSAFLLIWIPTAMLFGAFYFYPQIDSLINVDVDIIWYSFIAAYILTSMLAWVRFAFSFNEINKVNFTKPEKVQKLKVKEQAKPIVEKIIQPSESNTGNVKSDFDEDFLSSFASDTEEQLEELDDIDEFEKAMASYNKNMSSATPNIALNEEQKIAQPVTKAEPEPEPSKYDQFPDQSDQDALNALDDIPGSEDDFGYDIFTNEPNTSENQTANSENKQINDTDERSKSLDFELSDEFSSVNTELPEHLDIEQTEKNELPTINDFNAIEEINLKTAEEFNINEIKSSNESEVSLDIELETISDFAIEELEDIAPVEIIDEIQLETISTKQTTPPFDKEERLKNELEEVDDLSSELAKLDQELNELYEKNSETDLSKLDELIDAADVNTQTSNASQPVKISTSIESDKILFVAKGDEEIIEIFTEEAEEIFEELPQKINAFKNNNKDKEIIKELQRDFHTLKGGARMASIEPMGDLCHQYEMLFEKIGSGRKTPNTAIITLIDDGFIEVQKAIENIIKTKQYHFDQSLIIKLKAL
ncbi:Hpt domain-containing protein [Marinicellulosiphila megalodicopiae]|uniref:Hpt domain-containing protein n=1 Tax=Marinicellulosiphila megalodicopiae TaxID=2724896 RepID=UPI003BB1B345